ncbi:transcriptional regulator [Streptomyces sp. BI20]|uniref:transcriptional regulator n=1 Tax=Streptomyces sp. BI20 TaxID=3403460 RepID=UPI003C7487DA
MQPNALLDALLIEAGMSHAGFAERVNQAGRGRGIALRYEHTAVARWLKGQRPRGPVPELICEVLRDRLGRAVGPEDVGLVDAGAPAPGGEAPGGLSGFVDRTTALWRADERLRPRQPAEPALTGTRAVIPVWEWENPPEDIDVSRAGTVRTGPEHVAVLRAARAHYEAMYRRTGGLVTRPRITRFLGREAAPLLRAGHSDAVGRSLHRAAGSLVAVAGICAYDSDAHGQAQRSFHQALRLAKASGDRGLGAYVIALLVNQCLHLGEPRQAVAFAEAALRTAGRAVSPALAADLHAMQAKAYAALGDPGAALARVRQAEAAAERIDRGAEPAETGYVQPGLVNVQVAAALLGIGDLRGAREQAARAVSAPAHDRGLVHRLGVLCEVQFRQGEREAAAATAARMVGPARGMESRRLLERLRTVRELLAEGAPRSGAVRAGVDLLDEALRVPL